jgi:diguanylate cyclase (GGDEF)-like protein
MRNLLKDVGILADLCEAELRQVASFFDFHGYAKDEVLFQEGASGEELYIVGLGRVASWIRLADGGAHKVSEFGAGDFFGEMAIIERAPRSATCQALEPSAVFVLKAADFYRLLDEQPEIAIKIMNRMLDAAADRSIRTSEFLSDMVRWGDEARKRAVLDGLTGLFNRRFVEEALRDGLQKARAGGAALSLVMMDLDHFRQINQHYGADTGDQAIRALVPVLRSVLRAEDVPARLGGDEFAILLPGTPLQEAMRLAQAICAGVRELPFFEGRGGPLRRITTSQGIACFPEHGAEVKGLWEAADRALYRAKEQGRDQAALPPGK